MRQTSPVITHWANLFDARNGQALEFYVDETTGRFVPPTAADRTEDGRGQSVVPAFVDCHGHILPSGIDLSRPSVAAESREEALEKVADAHRARPDEWLLMTGYDQNRWGGPHLTRHELDAVAKDRPILLRHVNGHASVANSAALAAAGVLPREPDPAGGTYGRDEDGTLNGVLLETAHERVWQVTPVPNRHEMTRAIRLAADSMASLGIAAACDMMTGYLNLEDECAAYAQAEADGSPVAARLVLQWRAVFGPHGVGPERARKLAGDRLRGIKIFADGAIGSATAAIYGRYSGADASGGPRISSRGVAAQHAERETAGQLIYRPERLTEMVQIADAAGFSVSIHAIGDYAVDLVLDAFESTGQAHAHRLEHAMLLDDAQIERIAALGVPITFQPEFLVRFGHAYRAQLGVERAARLKRIRSVLAAGIPVGFSSDRPIVPGDPRDGIAGAWNRPEGFDPAENIRLEEALTAATQGAAKVQGDAGEFGTFAPGARAKWVTWTPLA